MTLTFSLIFHFRMKSWLQVTIRPFFLTPAAEKTKTQGQNSSKKLKEKTQPLGATLLQFVKTQEKTHLLAKISRGTPKYAIFITKYFQKGEHFGFFLYF